MNDEAIKVLEAAVRQSESLTREGRKFSAAAHARDGIRVALTILRAQPKASEREMERLIASQETPERVDFVARSLLGMSEPSADRILAAGKQPTPPEAPAVASVEERGGVP